MPQPDGESLALLKLTLSEGVGGVSIHRLIEAFGSARAALDASEQTLRNVEGVGDRTARSIRRGPDTGELELELDLLQRANTRLVPITSDQYPIPLRHLDASAPPLLWMRGEYLRRDMLALAVVGSRRATHYGRSQARRFAAGLSGMGFTIVSGLARGIDSEAHRAALQAGGRTIAVLGCGLGRVESLSDPELALEIAGHGALISELPMKAPPLAGHFPPRNRIIAGLSLGALVVEGGKKSGSLITARLAGEQGKGVFAVPGNVDSPASSGCHRLIRDGAVLVENPREVVEGLGPLSEPLDLPDAESADGEEAAPGGPQSLEDARALVLNEREREIFELLDSSPLQIEAVIERTGLPASIVSSTLLTLEIRGLVRQLPGQSYVRA